MDSVAHLATCSRGIHKYLISMQGLNRIYCPKKVTIRCKVIALTRLEPPFNGF